MADEIVLEVVTTFPDEPTARGCAERIVRAGVAACVQVEGPIQSIYVWEGKRDDATEWRCRCKTSPPSLAACVAALRDGHPYDVPQILWRECSAIPEYAAWVASATSTGEGCP